MKNKYQISYQVLWGRINLESPYDIRVLSRNFKHPVTKLARHRHEFVVYFDLMMFKCCCAMVII